MSWSNDYIGMAAGHPPTTPDEDTRRLVNEVRDRYPNLDAGDVTEYLRGEGHAVDEGRVHGVFAGL